MRLLAAAVAERDSLADTTVARIATAVDARDDAAEELALGGYPLATLREAVNTQAFGTPSVSRARSPGKSENTVVIGT